MPIWLRVTRSWSLPTRSSTGLLINHALIVALMHQDALTRLASHDADFDRVPGLTRYAPV